MSIAIQAENISKLYKLGEIGTGTLSHDLNRWWARLRGKPDPRLSVGVVNNSENSHTKDYIWALKDISFDIEQGQAVGIIGKNGAGKSTLLKILSQVTTPTTGVIRARGRMASLLEVGTGFHPEMTGRENIFMNGSILGMSRAEIRKQFDEIVDFSGCGKYIDTPVKRYSSGMYMRLAFAVAAHLEPDILVVDEVLAVGDAEFQKKCLGKMKDVSQKEGRTVLFVSHNVSAVGNLCSKTIVLKNGYIDFYGNVQQGISNYLQSGSNAGSSLDFTQPEFKHACCSFSRLLSLTILDDKQEPNTSLSIGNKMTIKIGFELFEAIKHLEIGFCFNNSLGAAMGGYISAWEGLQRHYEKGKHTVSCQIPFIHLLPDNYTISVWLKQEGYTIDDEIIDATRFEVIGADITGHQPYFDRQNYSQLGIFQRTNWFID